MGEKGALWHKVWASKKPRSKAGLFNAIVRGGLLSHHFKFHSDNHLFVELDGRFVRA